MFDLKVINSVLEQLEEERGIPKEKIIEAIEMALATAYKKEYGKKGQIIKASFDMNTGTAEFAQVKIVVDKDQVIMPEDRTKEEMEAGKGETEAPEIAETESEDDIEKAYFNPEHHILLENAQRMKKDAYLGEEITFPLENKDDFGRIAAQTAKQVVIQKIREAEKVSVLSEYGEREGEVISGTVQRVERGIVYIDMGRATGIVPFEEQIPGERFRPGERIRAYLYRVEESPRGIFLKLSRSHPKFLVKLFEQEVPEIASGSVEVKGVAREAGSRSKIAVFSHDGHIDPVGSMVGQRGVRVGTVMSELGGEKIDIIEWSDNIANFIEDSLSPAKIISVELSENEEEKVAKVTVDEDQQSLAIGKGGQNVRLAAKLTGYKIDIQSAKTDEEIAEGEPDMPGTDTDRDGSDPVVPEAATALDEIAEEAAEDLPAGEAGIVEAIADIEEKEDKKDSE